MDSSSTRWKTHTHVGKMCEIPLKEKNQKKFCFIESQLKSEK